MTDNQKIISRLRWLADAWEAGDVPQWLNCMADRSWRDINPSASLDSIIHDLKDDELRIKPMPYIRWQNEHVSSDGELYLGDNVFLSKAAAEISGKGVSNYVRTVKMVEAESDE